MGNANQRLEQPGRVAETESDRARANIPPEDPRRQFTNLQNIRQAGTAGEDTLSTEISDRSEKSKWQRAAGELRSHDLYQYGGAIRPNENNDLYRYGGASGFKESVARHDLYRYGGATESKENGASTVLDRRSELPNILLIDNRSDGRVQHDKDDHAGPGSLRRRKLRDPEARESSTQANHPQQSNSDSSQRHPQINRDAAKSGSADRLNPADRSNPVERTNPAPRSVPGDGTVSEINVQQLKNLIQNSDRPIVLDVYKHGCPGCDALEPTMHNVAAQYKGRASVYRMNVTELARDPELRAQMRISAVPTTFIYDEGKMVNRDVGPKDARYYGSRINGLISKHEAENPPHQHHPLSARLHKIKEKLARLTHFSHKEREDAFNPTSEELRTMDLINQRRRQHHLPDVVQDPRLQLIARRHTAYQMSHGMTHNENTPGWQNVSQRMSQVGLQGWRENAATGAFTPETLVQMWMDSPPHRAALLGQGNIAAVAIRGGKATFNLTTDSERY